ncbi:MAG TPA: TIM barrel protein [bacterium]|nr:TIM barrel protein [bacterium]
MIELLRFSSIVSGDLHSPVRHSFQVEVQCVMKVSRRQFLETGLQAAAACTVVSCRSASLSSKPSKLPIGLQLYSVRKEFSADVPGTLKEVGKMGYEGVEFWGYKGTPEVYEKYDAKSLRKILDDNGLKCFGMHLMLEALEGEALQRTIDNNRILGNPFLIVAAAMDKMGSEETIKELASFLNGVSVKCRAQDMWVGYHAHGFDFKKIGDRFAWDLLFSQADPEVIMQMDIGNCLSGGGDPIAMLKKFPGRSLSVHIKEYEDKTFDSRYYEEVFHLCETISNTQRYVVEMEGEGGRGFEVPRNALAKLRGLGK